MHRGLTADTPKQANDTHQTDSLRPPGRGLFRNTLPGHELPRKLVLNLPNEFTLHDNDATTLLRDYGRNLRDVPDPLRQLVHEETLLLDHWLVVPGHHGLVRRLLDDHLYGDEDFA